jgi:zinc/manganese transport system substrate-binding protein
MPDPPSGIIRPPYAESKASLWLAERLGVPALTLPFTVGGSPRASDLFGLFDDTLSQLEEIGE